MNKKLLFGIMSLAALAACTTDDFESQQTVAEGVSSIPFELINDDDAQTRASWNDDNKKVSFSATDGDLFTLYHGGALAGTTLGTLENATYTAQEGTPATLTTPSMIKVGKAIMVWPVDTAFAIKPADDFSISIPVEQTDYVNQIPYVSDLIDITDEADWTNPTAAYNKAGYKRTYPVFMRQMGSLLTLKADYAGTDATLAALETGDDAIAAITVDKITLSTGAGTEFTKTIPVKFTAANANWPAAATIHHAWEKVTEFDVASILAAGKTTTLSAEGESLLEGNGGAKIIMLPQAAIDETTPTATDPTGVVDAAVTVDTYYGKVVVAAPGVAGSQYTALEYDDAWIRYLKSTTGPNTYETKAGTAEASGENAGLYKTTSNIQEGLMQTINWFSSADRKSTYATILNEPVGGLLTRYVKVLLTHLDMTDLHIKTDKQLRDVARVWKQMGLNPVTVYLDGDANKEFAISQKTIEVINGINGAYNAISNPTPKFKVKPCTVAGEACDMIVITGSDYKQDVQDIAFIADNAGTKVKVALADEGTAKPWIWNEEVKVEATAVDKIRNRGTMENAATMTLQTVAFDGTANNVALINNGTWNVKSPATLNVQFTVNNNGTVDIAKGAQYRQDGTGHRFQNQSSDKPSRFGGDDSKIGVVINKGVFATVDGGQINNVGGLIEHADVDAKTYITSNQTGGDFATAYGGSNKMGRINLPWSNKDEDNVSVSSALDQGFVSVTVDGEVTGALNATAVGAKVNYVIVKSGITEIQAMPAQVKYLEINQSGTELAWNVANTTVYDGLIVLSPVNIKLGTKVIATTTYLGADMYVGGKFNKAAIAAEGADPAYAATNFSGYYGNTSANAASKYITY